MERDSDFAMPLKNKYRPDKTCHGAWTGSSGDLSFSHSMTYREVHSGNIKFKNETSTETKRAFHSWNTISCFFREWVETEGWFFFFLWNIYLCPLILLLTIIFPNIIWMKNAVFKFLCLVYAQKYGWEWPRISGYKCNSGDLTITCTCTSFTPVMYSDVQNITITIVYIK